MQMAACGDLVRPSVCARASTPSPFALGAMCMYVFVVSSLVRRDVRRRVCAGTFRDLFNSLLRERLGIDCPMFRVQQGGSQAVKVIVAFCRSFTFTFSFFALTRYHFSHFRDGRDSRFAYKAVRDFFSCDTLYSVASAKLSATHFYGYICPPSSARLG